MFNHLSIQGLWPCSQGCSTDTQSCENVRQEKNQTMKKQSAEMLELEAGAVLCFVCCCLRPLLAFLNTEKRNIEKSRTRTVFQSHGWGKSFERLRGFLLHLNAAPFIPQWNIELHLSQQQKNTLTRNSILSRTIGSRTFQDSSTYLRC